MTTKNGTAGTRWMIGILVLLGMTAIGWSVSHHESDMVGVGVKCMKNAEAIGHLAERTVRLDANLANLTANVAEIKKDVAEINDGVAAILTRLPRRMK